jgi:hypothetical protein
LAQIDNMSELFQVEDEEEEEEVKLLLLKV